MTDKPVIRPSRAEDLDAVVAIYNAAIPTRLSTAEPVPVSVASKKPWFLNRDAVTRPLYVMEQAGKVIGWVELKDHYGRAAYAKTAEVSVYISQDSLGQGLGSTLLDFIIAEARTIGLKTLLAVCFAHNHASVRLFQARGFERWGYYPGVAEMDGQDYDVVNLGLKL